MTPEELDAIEARASGEDVPKLVAEVRRLQMRVVSYRIQNGEPGAYEEGLALLGWPVDEVRTQVLMDCIRNEPIYQEYIISDLVAR